MTKLLIGRGYIENLIKGVIEGVPLDIIEKYIDRSEVPKQSIDSQNHVHLWGVPKIGKYWYSIKPGDILVILPVKKSKKLESAYISIIVDKFPKDINDESISLLKNLSTEIFNYINVVIDKHGKKEKKRYESFPYILFLKSKVLSLPLKELLSILELDYSALMGYRRSLQISRKVSKKSMDKILKLIESIPSPEMLLKYINEAYLELAGNYGVPVLTSPLVWGSDSSKGLFEKLNEILVKEGYRTLTWEEFRSFLKVFDSPRYYGVVYISWGVGKKPGIEPLTIAIYAPLF